MALQIKNERNNEMKTKVKTPIKHERFCHRILKKEGKCWCQLSQKNQGKANG